MTTTYVVTWSVELEAYTPQQAAELAKKAQQLVNVFEVNGMEIDLDSKEYLEYKLQQLNHDILGLECGDERLATNGNGQLSLYQSKVAERAKTTQKLGALK